MPKAWKSVLPQDGLVTVHENTWYVGKGRGSSYLGSFMKEEGKLNASLTLVRLNRDID